MVRFLFSIHGRIGRASFWLGQLLLLALAVGGTVLAMAIVALGSAGKPADADLGALGIVAVVAAFLIVASGGLALIASSVCLGIRRFHDRDKPGIWVAIQFVPVIGAFWYVIETGFLPGTVGANTYGGDPLGPPGAPLPDAPTPRLAAPAGRPGWVVPVMLALALPGLLVMVGSAAFAWRSHSWLAAATVIPGRVVGLEPVVSTDASKQASYRAVIAATTPEGASVRVVDTWAVSPPPAIGDAREVAYDGAGPDHAVPVGFWDFYGWPSLVGGLTAVFVLPWLAATALVAALWKRRPAPPLRVA